MGDVNGAAVISAGFLLLVIVACSLPASSPTPVAPRFSEDEAIDTVTAALRAANDPDCDKYFLTAMYWTGRYLGHSTWYVTGVTYGDELSIECHVFEKSNKVQVSKQTGSLCHLD